MRFENPHSLSYQLNTFAIFSLMTVVIVASNMEECGLPIMSELTNNRSLYWSFPLS